MGIDRLCSTLAWLGLWFVLACGGSSGTEDEGSLEETCDSGADDECGESDPCDPAWACGEGLDARGRSVVCGSCAADQVCVAHQCIAPGCDGCMIGGVCFAQGQSEPLHPCRVCAPARARDAFSDAPDGASCDDGLACTVSDRCAQGSCGGSPMACDDGLACNGQETCDEGSATCAPGEVTCDDGALCDATSGACVKACASGCIIDGMCWPAGQTSVQDACLVCQPQRSASAWSLAEGEMCHAHGVCSGTVEAPVCKCSRVDYSPLCQPWDQVASHFLNTCAISGGALFCWGPNDDGQLGTGDRVGRSVATRVGTRDDWDFVSVGVRHACALSTGRLYCWGSEAHGALGHAGTPLVPTQVGNESDWMDVATGNEVTCGIRGTGDLYCWGTNPSSILGVGSDAADVTAPERVTTLTDVSEVDINLFTICALQQGQLWCWGGNGSYQLDDTGYPKSEPTRLTDVSDWASVDVGPSTCAIRSGGALWCWGGSLDYRPKPVTAYSDWQSISNGNDFRCGIRDGDKLYCWGSNDAGRLGNGTLNEVFEPVAVAGKGYAQVEAGKGHACAIRDGGLYCWGENERGERGSGPNLPRKVGAEQDWTDISLGLGYACGIRAGELYCWGDWLGSSYSQNSSVPVRLGDASDWTAVGASQTSACGVRAGELYCWGYDFYGSLGSGNAANTATVPIRVGTLDDWVSVAGEWNTLCGIRGTTGELYCWGRGDWGQVGDGAQATRYSPVQIAELGWSAVDANAYHGCGVRNGELHCWGHDAFGGLGAGVPEAKTPLRIGTGSSWADVSTGMGNSCGVHAGALYCWGLNVGGNLGLGDVSKVLTPTQLLGFSDWTQVGLTSFSSCAARADGSLYCWGENTYGQLGTGDFEGRNVPTRSGTLAGWQKFSIDNTTACGIREGELWCWGSNARGSLGNGAGLTPALIADPSDAE